MELANCLKNFQFTKAKNIKTTEDLAHIAMAIKLQIFEKNSTIINYGDVGENFYMLLKGHVSVYIPEMVKVSETDYKERKELTKRIS